MSAAPSLEPGAVVDGVVHAILTCVTAGPGLGFHRAALMLPDEAATRLVGVMAIGPATPEEAGATWARLAHEHVGIDEMLSRPQAYVPQNEFERRTVGLTIPLDGPADAAVRAFRERRVVTATDPASLARFPAALRQVFAGTQVVCVPLVAKDRSIGLIIADNLFSREPFDEQRIELLQLLALLAGLALDNAAMYRRLARQAIELEEALATVRTTQAQLLRAERLAAVGTAVARVTHEVRNPLSTIGGFARRLLQQPEDADRVARTAAIVVHEVEKLETFLRELLDYTSPRVPARRPTDVNRLVESLAAVRTDELRERGIALALELGGDVPKVPGDERQLDRAFLNVWQNAVQTLDAAPSDRPRWLRIRTWRDAGNVHVSFADSGPGIAREDVGHLFEPFFTTRPQGTGLGLAVVKQVVDAHRGTVRAESPPGSGAVFTITLPLEG